MGSATRFVSSHLSWLIEIKSGKHGASRQTLWMPHAINSILKYYFSGSSKIIPTIRVSSVKFQIPNSIFRKYYTNVTEFQIPWLPLNSKFQIPNSVFWNSKLILTSVRLFTKISKCWNQQQQEKLSTTTDDGISFHRRLN